MPYPKIKSIAIVGSGNVATHFCKVLHQKGFCISIIISRSKENAQKLASIYGATYDTEINSIPKKTDIILLAVTDAEIIGIGKKLRYTNSIILHTSGSVPMDVLSKTSPNYGVLYPLQTFSKTSKVKFSKCPLLVEASTEALMDHLIDFGLSISKYCFIANSETRSHYHLAAVFANNFTNHLIYLAFEYLRSKGIKHPELLFPLIEETVNKLKTTPPKEAQTGPARRKDQVILDKHLSMVRDSKQLTAIYKSISDSIQKSYD